jgi:hypothetical protein
MKNLIDNRWLAGLVKRLALPLFVSFGVVLTGCSGGSGSGTESNINTEQEEVDTAIYEGPAPVNADVQAFKLNVWDQLIDPQRCAGCHSTGGQTPVFMRADDINAAYQIAETLVDRSNPANSRLVTKVAGGHNCWLDSDVVCGSLMTDFISGWVSGTESAVTEIVLTAPPIKDVSSSKTFPADSTEFAPVHALLSEHCGLCHSESGGQGPTIGSSDIDVSYSASRSRINIDNPASSRLVERLRFERHNCWSGADQCGSDAQVLEDAIAAFAGTISVQQVDPNLAISKALILEEDGIVANTSGRVETNVIAKYEFKAGEGVTAYDTSGVEPALNLTLVDRSDDGTGVRWLSSWGIALADGKAQGSTASSKKLYDQITLTNEYTIEAWVVPNNVSQDGPARIVTYSGGNDRRNFTLGQTLYNYDVLNRSSVTDGNGMPALSTADADERLQATLQHVVVTYDPVEGRRIYVNGEYTGDGDSLGGGTLSEWDDSFALVLGDEASNDNPWQGTFRYLAIYNRKMAEADILTNFEAGVGQKYYLLFNVDEHTGLTDSFVVFQVEQFDDHSYLFNEPFFTVLGASGTYSGIAIEGVRLGINGREAAIGQAFANLNETLSSDQLLEGRQLLSSIGTVIQLESGPAFDEFFLTFDRLGNDTSVRVVAAPPVPAAPADIPDLSSVGLRLFEQINYALSEITQVPVDNAGVEATYAAVRQQLPTTPAIDSFLAAHQMGITQLAVQYCSQLIDDTSLRATVFPGFDFNAAPGAAYGVPLSSDSNSLRSRLINPLLEAIAVQEIAADGIDYPSAASLKNQPTPQVVGGELDGLIERMAALCSSDCNSALRTQKVAKAVCSAAAGNAVMLLQ